MPFFADDPNYVLPKHGILDTDWSGKTPEQKQKLYDRLERLGLVAPRKDGILTELAEGAEGAAYGVGKGLGSTLEEATGYSGMKQYFGDVMRRNQQLNPYPGYKALSLNPTDIARTIGSGAAQSTLSLAGGVAATALSGGNPVAGVIAGTATMFGQVYGDRVQEYREAFPDEDESVVKGYAFLSSLGESFIETLLGPEQLATGIAKKWATGALKETTNSLLKTVGKEAVKNFITEGSEEVAQDFWDRICRSALEEEGLQLPSWEEVGETFMGGAWSGLALGGVGGAVESIGSRNKTAETTTAKPPVPPAGETSAPVAPAAEAETTAEEETIPYDPESERKTKLTLADQVAKELGIKVRYFDEAKTRGKDMDISDGWYDEKTNEIWLDREDPNTDVLQTLGHEFKHYLDDKHEGLVNVFNEMLRSFMNEAGTERMNELEKLYSEAGRPNSGFNELSADAFGQFWTDPEFWREVATRAEKMDAGMGQKFLDTLQEFIKIVKAKLKKIGTPEAKQLFDNMNELRDEAADILAEIKRQNGTSTEEENVVGVNGSTTVESIPVSEINLDPERFQFKSNTNKKTGVDESNKLGGEWDPKSAGILYLWEDKDGNKFVVNGHHRLDLARRKNVNKLNAIVDREVDGVTAEQARRNGVLINIRDEQGEVRDYADFVRSEKLDEETAEKEGVLSRRKGRAGFAIGHYASDNLYATYRNGDISDTAAAAIADIARGDTGLENAGIRAAKNGMKKIQLIEHLKFLKTVPRQAAEDKGDLFGGFDDSALKLSEELSAKALDHIEELKEQINAAKAAVKNPDAAKKLGVSVGKEAQNLLDRTKRQLHDWENWQTNKKLRDQLLRETGNTMPEAAPAAEPEKKQEEKPVESKDEGRFNPDSETPLLTPEEDANDFTLIGQTPEEAKADEQAAERREEAARDRADQQSKRETPDLIFDDAKIQDELRNVIAQPIPENLKLARLKRLAKTWGMDYNDLKKRYDALANPVENSENGDIVSSQPETQGVSNDDNAGNEAGDSGRPGLHGTPVEHGGLQEESATGTDTERDNTGISSEDSESLPRNEEQPDGSKAAGESSSGRGTGSELHAPDGERPGNETVRVDSTRSTDSERVVGENVSGREESPGTGRGRTSGEAGRVEGRERTPERSGGSVSDDSVKNHRIGKDDELVVGGDKAKIKANIAAIKLLKKLEAENREATPDEKKVLAKYVGWGGLKNVFSPYHSDYVPELKTLLTKDEYEAAERSILNAHYTDRAVIEKMWKLAEKLGFKGGKVGEFGAGIGHFLGLVPDNLVNKTKFRAVELDSITGRLLKKLYPEADVTVAGLQDTRIPNNSLSLVIGNVPFSEIKIYDKRYPESFALHNYFIARSIDAVKPGGLVVTISTHGTMDAIGTHARKHFAERADFLGAIRLPSNAFQKNAGTDVVTDILVFRKKDGTVSSSENFIQTVDFEDDEEKVPLNEYFSAHPDMMLGTPSIGHGMYANNSFLLEAKKGADLSSQIDDAMKKIFEAHKPKKDIDATIYEELPTDTDKKNLKDGELYIENGQLYEWHRDSDGTPNPARVQQNSDAANKKAVARVAAFQELKKAHNMLINGMIDDCSDGQLKVYQGLLKQVYDQFVKKFGNIADFKAQKLLRNDPTYLRASGLESVSSFRDKDGKMKYTYTPADIFTKRTIVMQKEPTHASSAKEAADISMKFRGHLDPEYMESLTGKDFDSIKNELTENGDYFENPENGLLESKEDYLSGNIKEKLERATEEAKDNPAFEKNVEALQNAMPPRKSVKEFQFRLGARWIPVSVIKKWCESDLGGTKVSIFYNKAADLYSVSGIFSTREFDAYGYGAEDLIKSALSLKKLEVWESLPHGKRRLDHEATQAVEELQKRLIARFHDYVTGNADATKAIEDAYNSDVNVFVSREMSNTETDSVYPGAADTVNGKPIRLRSYQRNAVSRMMRQNTLLAHCVGAGKTYTMITAAMELVRTKMAKKPLIVVQNATIRQFGTSAASLYPTAKILCVDKDDFTKENRQRTISKIANNEWDLIILPQSQFNRLDVTPESKASYYQAFIDELRWALETAEDRMSERDIQRRILAFEEKLKKVQGKSTKKDEAFYFNELGVDAIFIDEAHAYKKPFFVTNMKRIKGLNTETSERSIDLSIKLDEIKKKTGGRNIFFATGTPITNTLAEAWHMVRYLTPEGKMPYGCETFDQFASMFCEIENVTEPNAAGQYQSINRFSKFTNLQELSVFFRSVADVVLPEDLKNEVKRPPLKNGKPTEIIIEKSPYMDSFMRYLGDTYLWYNRLSGKEKKEAGPIPLIANTSAAKATADMRLIQPSLPEDPDSKISRCAVEVKKRYDATKDVRGAQCVFLDLFRHTNSATKKVVFNAYDELKRKLVEQGIPENEIQSIDKFQKDEDKKKLFEDVNAGRVRVIIGGTETLGTGVNIQERLAAVHHLDATYMPSGMEQRNGRILRQGNTIPEVEIVQYAIKGTLDEVKYQLLARKQKFIDSVMRGDAVGEFEDDDSQNFNYERFSAMISGNKDAMRYVEAKDELNKVRNSYQLYLLQKSEAQKQLQQLKDAGIPNAEKLVKTYEDDKKILSKFDFDKIAVTSGGKTQITNKKLFAEYLDKQIQSGKATAIPVNLSGIDFEIEVNVPSGMSSEDTLAIGTGEKFNRYTMTNFRGRSAEFKSGAGFMQSLNAFINGADKRIADAKTELELRKQQIPSLEEAVKRTFPDTERMNELDAEVAELKTKLTTNEDRVISERPDMNDYFDVGVGLDIMSGDSVFEDLGTIEPEQDNDAKQLKLKERRHVNPIREEGEVKEKYQEILDKTPYESKSKKVLNTQAARMLAGFGGIDGTIKAIENGDFKPTSDVAQRALQIVLNSEEFKRLSEDERASVANAYIKSGTEAGRTLASRRLGALDTSDILSVQAHVNAIVAKMGKENAHRLRDEILHELGFDIDNLPDDIVNEPRELDKVLRKLISARSKWTDKWYEYWINAILSSPTTHVANTLGNVTNAVYELGVKRFAEATINAFLKRKDAATFGEFKEMTRAIDWKDAWRRAQFMFDVETMDTHSKLDTIHAAIGGKTGRIVRIPGRLLRAADEFAKAVVVPIEAAAYAYRQGANLGYSDDVLREFIQDQLKNEKSLANEWGKMRSLELTFQEQQRPGSAVNYLIQLREAGGISGTIMKFVLPFIKTPSNILKQGIRKSPLGAVNIAWQTVKGVAGKREFDSEYVSLAAEQLLAWGVVMMLAGSDDDDKPFITGSSPQYGSAETRFKANKVPPYSIRIGKNYYSYQRIEPLSTGLAFIADGIEAYKAAKRGEDGQKIMRTLIAKSGRLISEKSFLDSIGTITKIAQDPEQSGMKYLTNFAASWSPNIVRHTINMFDDNVREGKARDRGLNWFEEQFYATMNAAGLIKASPKYDYFGRPIKKDSLTDSGPLWQMMRLVPIKSVSPDDNMNRAERLMWKYNMTHPGEEYYPDVPAYYFQRDGQKLYTTGKYWDEFAQKSGQLALKQINNAFKHGLLNERNPSKEDIDLIKKIFTRARKEVRDEMYQRKHYQR